MNDLPFVDVESERLALAQALRRMWDVHDNGPATAQALAQWPAEFVPSGIATREQNATRFLQQLVGISAPTTQEFVRSLDASSSLLHWRQTYTVDQMSADFLDKYCWASLVGDKGLFSAEGFIAAVMIIGPHTEYPRHRHNNPEVYLTLAGTAEWSVGTEDWRSVRPGTVVPIENNSWHGMRTGAEPLLVAGLCLVESILPSVMEAGEQTKH